MTLRILFDGQQLTEQMTGVGYYTDRVLRAMLRLDREHEWLVLCHAANAGYVEKLIAGGRSAGLLVLKTPVPLDYRVQQDMLSKLLPEQRVALYFSPSFLAAPKDVCPSVSVVHDATYVLYPEFHGGRVAEYLHQCVASTCANASLIVTMSENSKRDIVRFYHYPAERIRVVPLAADGEFARDKTAETLTAARNKYKLPERYVLAVNMGNPKKNVQVLLGAYARLPKELRATRRLAIVGEWSPGAQDLPALVKKHGLEGEVVLTGFVPREDLCAIYAGAEIFCFPSLHEGFGLPVVEAMASGVPVVSSNAASLPEVAAGAAAMVSPRDEAGWARTMVRLLRDEPARKDLAQRSRRRAAELSWERTAQSTLAAIAEALPAGSGGPAAVARSGGRTSTSEAPAFEPLAVPGLTCAITVDDVRPEPGFGGRRKEDTLGLLLKLYEEYGAKFTLFVPTNWKAAWPVAEHLDWLGWLLEQPCFEVACHGHLHAVAPGSGDPGEFRGIGPGRLEEILGQSLEVFTKAGHRPAGVRPPGWLLEPSAYQVFNRRFRYVADHFEDTGAKRLSGAELLRFPYLYTIDKLGVWPETGLAVLQSHIAPEGRTMNGWGRGFYERVQAFLATGKRMGARFVTLAELASELGHWQSVTGKTVPHSQPGLPVSRPQPAIALVSEPEPRLRGGAVKVLGSEAGVLYNAGGEACPFALSAENAGIVILSRNRRKYLAELLSSIDSSSPATLGRLVILNNSEDDSAEHVKRHFSNWRVLELTDVGHAGEPAGLAWLEKHMPDILPRPAGQLGPNSGWTELRSIAWLRNHQFTECGRDFLISFDDDFVVRPGWWEYYLRFQHEFRAHAVINNFGAYLMCRTIPERIGWFDERFLSSHGYEDNDYAARIAEAKVRWVLGFNAKHDWRSAEEGNPRGSMTGADYFVHRYALRSGGYSARRDEASADPARAQWNARWYAAKWEETPEDTGIWSRPPFMGKFLRRKISEEPDWHQEHPSAGKGPVVPRGHRRYFIDCGAHVGESIVRAREVFGQDTFVVAFEGIPEMARRLRELYADDPQVLVHNAIVWCQDGTKRLYISREWSDGSSVYATKSCGGVGADLYVEAPCLDLSRWLRDNFRPSDEVILKLDVEGAEYAILSGMIRDGTIGLVKGLYGEWHAQKIADQEFKAQAVLVHDWLKHHEIQLHLWEAHGVTGKLAERPKDMKALATNSGGRGRAADGSKDNER